MTELRAVIPAEAGIQLCFARRPLWGRILYSIPALGTYEIFGVVITTRLKIRLLIDKPVIVVKFGLSK
jgi:hypothetical protein